MSRIKLLCLLCAVAAMTVLCADRVLAEPISVPNAGFEDPVLVEGDYTEMTANPNYFFRPSRNATTTSTLTSPVPDEYISLQWGVTSASAVIVVGIIAVWRRDV